MLLPSLITSAHPTCVHDVSRRRIQGAAGIWRTSCMLAVATVGLSGCTTLPNGHGWGQDVTVAPGWERVRESAAHALADLWVWAPLARAAATQVDHGDRRISSQRDGVEQRSAQRSSRR
jgi:hypothetical protein